MKCGECGKKADIKASWMVHTPKEEIVEAHFCFECGKEFDKKLAPTVRDSLVVTSCQK